TKRDWSSDVCSSDLAGLEGPLPVWTSCSGPVSLPPSGERPRGRSRSAGRRAGLVKRSYRGIVLHCVSLLREVLAGFGNRRDTLQIGRASCRERVRER